MFSYLYKNMMLVEEDLKTPLCNKNNPNVFFIENHNDWKMINDKDKRIFCVKAGDYSILKNVILETNGTELERRYILLDDSSSKHPAQLDESMLAKVALKFNNTSFWVVDRISYGESTVPFIPFLFYESDNNIMNRCFIKDVKGGGIVLYSGSDNNLIQNCRFERTKVFNYMDRAAIELNNHGENNISIKDNQIISNEIVNYVDGIQTVKTGSSNQRYINYEGTKIINNHIYIDDLVYTNCHGKLDNGGDCAYAENAIDLKAGSENSKNPLIISDNKMWGYRKADKIDYTKDKNNSTLSDQGASIAIHFNVKNVIFSKNVFFDSNLGIVIGGQRHGYSAENIQINNNLFYNIYASAIYATQTKNISIKNNSFNKISYGLRGDGKNIYNAMYFNNSKNINYENNTFINALRNIKFYIRLDDYKGEDDDTYSFSGNKWFNAKYSMGEDKYEKSMAITVDNNIQFDVKGFESIHKNLEITTDKFTNSSKNIILPKVLE